MEKEILIDGFKGKKRYKTEKKFECKKTSKLYHVRIVHKVLVYRFNDGRGHVLFTPRKNNKTLHWIICLTMKLKHIIKKAGN